MRDFLKDDKQFLSRLSHEVRSPIARMQAALALLERRSAGRDTPYVADLREELELLSSVAGELLTFAEVELRKDAMPLVTTSVAEAAHRVARAEDRNGVVVEVDVPESLAVRAVPEYLFRALAGAVRHAVREAGEAGPIRVEAGVDGARILITVTDRGPRLTEAGLREVFEPFHRADPASGRNPGRGLGLALVRSCIEACGGSVDCANAEPTGVVVRMALPPAP